MLHRLFILFTLLFSTFLYSEEEGDYLEWEEVKKAPGYFLEIRDEEKKVIIKEKLETNSYPIENLKPGNYEHRISVLNKFGKPGIFSEWISFKITKSLIPEIEPPLSYAFPENEKDNSISVKGKNFLDVMKVRLIDKSGKEVEAFKFEILNENELKLSIDTTQIQKGSYSIVLENPKRKIKKYSNFYSVKTKEEVTAQNRDSTAEPGKKSEIKPVEPRKVNELSFVGKSSVLPGWGQYSKGHKIKAFVFPFFLLGTAVFYIKKYNDFQSESSNYNKYNNIGFYFALDSNLSIPLLYAVNKAQSSYHDGKQTSNELKVASVVIGLLYLANLVDARWSKMDEKPKAGLQIGNDLELYADWRKGAINPMTGKASQEFELGLRYDF